MISDAAVVTGTGTATAQRSAQPLRWRRSAARLTVGQRQILRRAFASAQAIGDDRGYAYFAGIHGLPLPVGCDIAHGTPYFLPWHRAYLYFFEQALRDREAQATLTWWDWRTSATRTSRLPPLFADAQVDGAPNPLFDAPVASLARQEAAARGFQMPEHTHRRVSRPDALRLPTPEDIERLLELRDFKSFSDQLEAIHGQIHVWIGGTMSQIDFAAYDPVFWAHHTMVDRLWRIWQTRHPGAGPPATVLDESLPPFKMTVRQTLSVTALGYDYAGATSSARSRA